MSAQLLSIHPQNPEPRKIAQVVEVLRKGGVIIYPTDTVYGLGCDISQRKALERVRQIKGVKSGKADFSFICHDLSHIAEYAQVETSVFKVMKRALPGPFTFILPASHKVPKMLDTPKKTVGIRIPDHAIPRMLVKELGHPILTTSIRDEDIILEYSTDPELIFERFRHQVDLVVNGGSGNLIPSTVVDATGSELEVIRQGAGNLEEFL
jgi:tRNA threonylcarbamoyl adenosine modification protein (Sua5/YciO/YrdC/YwlC family)